MVERSSEEEHTARPAISGFIYQYYYFIYQLLTMNEGEEVSFEKYDDAAVEKDGSIVMIQCKNTVDVSSHSDKSKNLTNRASDLWKAISVWLKLIKEDNGKERSVDEQLEYIQMHEFKFVTNKEISRNLLAKLCSNHNKDSELNDDDIKNTLNDISRKGNKRDSCVQLIIDELANFELKKNFLSKVSFETISIDQIKDKCYCYIRNVIRIEDNYKQVLDSLKVEIDQDFTQCMMKNKPLCYTYEQQLKRFNPVFNHMRGKPFVFEIKEEGYNKDFLNFICVQQLLSVKNLDKSDTDGIAKIVSEFLSFRNKYEDLRGESKITDIQGEKFLKEAISSWENDFNHRYRKLGQEASEDEICDVANDIIYEVRKLTLNLFGEILETRISNGVFYYLSDIPRLGWHRDWKDIYSKK